MRELESTLEAAVTAAGFELVHYALSSAGRRTIIRVFIDSPEGITVENCRAVSQQIGSALDVANVFQGDYILEVSSPGLDRVLVKPEHYQRFIGSRLHIKLRHDLEGRRNFTGELVAATHELIQINVDGQLFELPLANIDKANLVPAVRM